MEDLYDIIVVGAGPAGLTAGLYASRSKLKVLVIEKDTYGGQITTTAELENYPGSIENCTGPALSNRMKTQAEEFGTEFIKDEIIDMDLSSTIKLLKSAKAEYRAKVVIIATGTAPRLAGFKNELDYRGRGVSYCATCDADFFEGLDIVVIGGGDSAITEALYLTKFAASITIIHRRATLRAAKSIQEKAFNHPKIKFLFNSIVEEVSGEGIVEEVIVKNLVNNETTILSANGVFVYTGLNPITEVFRGHIELDAFGYIPTTENMETNVEGVYAAGDVRVKILRQVITAASDGAISSFSAEEYISHKYVENEKNISSY
jgi:thioredoxin reductase (NADPH)